MNNIIDNTSDTDKIDRLQAFSEQHQKDMRKLRNRYIRHTCYHTLAFSLAASCFIILFYLGLHIYADIIILVYLFPIFVYGTVQMVKFLLEHEERERRLKNTEFYKRGKAISNLIEELNLIINDLNRNLNDGGKKESKMHIAKLEYQSKVDKLESVINKMRKFFDLEPISIRSESDKIETRVMKCVVRFEDSVLPEIKKKETKTEKCIRWAPTVASLSLFGAGLALDVAGGSGAATFVVLMVIGGSGFLGNASYAFRFDYKNRQHRKLALALVDQFNDIDSLSLACHKAMIDFFRKYYKLIENTQICLKDEDGDIHQLMIVYNPRMKDFLNRDMRRYKENRNKESFNIKAFNVVNHLHEMFRSNLKGFLEAIKTFKATEHIAAYDPDRPYKIIESNKTIPLFYGENDISQEFVLDYLNSTSSLQLKNFSVYENFSPGPSEDKCHDRKDTLEDIILDVTPLKNP